MVPATLAVAPQEAATFQVEGGTPPYTVGPAPGSTTGSTGGTDYLAFPLTANGGSGGFAAVNGAQVDYAAGTGDTTAGQHTRDSFVVRDAKGATVTVHVDIGPPVAVDFGNAGKPLSVPPGVPSPSVPPAARGPTSSGWPARPPTVWPMPSPAATGLGTSAASPTPSWSGTTWAPPTRTR